MNKNTGDDKLEETWVAVPANPSAKIPRTNAANEKNTGDGELDKLLDNVSLNSARGYTKVGLKAAIKKYAAQEANKAQRQPLKELLRELPKEVEAEEPNHNMPHSPEVAADQARNYTIQEITSLIQNKLEGLS